MQTSIVTHTKSKYFKIIKEFVDLAREYDDEKKEMKVIVTGSFALYLQGLDLKKFEDKIERPFKDLDIIINYPTPGIIRFLKSCEGLKVNGITMGKGSGLESAFSFVFTSEVLGSNDALKKVKVDIFFEHQDNIEYLVYPYSFKKDKEEEKVYLFSINPIGRILAAKARFGRLADYRFFNAFQNYLLDKISEGEKKKVDYSEALTDFNPDQKSN